MSKKQYEKFSLGLALFDALPVIFFSAAMILIAMHFRVAAFIAGAICCTAAGLGKVCWKIIIAETGKDIWPLNRQLRILMPAGFALMIIGLIMGMDKKLDGTKVKSNWIEQINKCNRTGMFSPWCF